MESSLLPYFAAGFGFLAVTLMSIGIAQLRRVADRQDKHDAKLVRIETILTGANGDNGINGEVKALRQRVEDVDRRIGPSDRRLA